MLNNYKKVTTTNYNIATITMAERKRTVMFLVVGLLAFISMAFFIIASVTAPAFHQIGLAKSNGFTYGTLGYCQDGCSRASASYHPETLDDDENTKWFLPQSSRAKLSRILIVAPVAAGLNFFTFASALVLFALPDINIGALFFVNLTLSVLTFFASALVCVVDIIQFYPHVTWCAWILVPAAVFALMNIPLFILAHVSQAKEPSTMRTRRSRSPGWSLMSLTVSRTTST